MATKIEELALHIMRGLYVATDGRPMQYRMLAGISATKDTEAAVQFAVDKGWLLIEGGHSICLTDQGRQRVKPA